MISLGFSALRVLIKLVFPQFEATDGPLEKLTTAEAIRVLIDFYRTSQYSYAAKQKVDEMSKAVSSPFGTD